jgi:ABC-type sugar transport system ATPase subunit
LTEAAVSLRGVSKRFGATHALAAVDLDILDGEIHALVG